MMIHKNWDELERIAREFVSEMNVVKTPADIRRAVKKFVFSIDPDETTLCGEHCRMTSTPTPTP